MNLYDGQTLTIIDAEAVEYHTCICESNGYSAKLTYLYDEEYKLGSGEDYFDWVIDNNCINDLLEAKAIKLS